MRRKVEILSPANSTQAQMANNKKNLHLTRQAERALRQPFSKTFQIIDKQLTFYYVFCEMKMLTTKLLHKLQIDYETVKDRFKMILLTKATK